MSSSLSPGTTASTPSESCTETRRRRAARGRRCVYGEAVTEGLVVPLGGIGPRCAGSA